MRFSFSFLPLLFGMFLLPGTKKDSLLPFSNGPLLKGREPITEFFGAVDSAQDAAFTLTDLQRMMQRNAPSRMMLGKTKQGRSIDAWYFPGTSSKRALVIGGMHGSELSSIEMAEALVARLRHEISYYSVIVIPSLFPDNAAKAMAYPDQLGSVSNIGRYSSANGVDPNRQMPSPGHAFSEEHPVDHMGRTIEQENQFLLMLIRDFRPSRIANLHAIRNLGYGGVYADPRTDASGRALGYSADSSLAIEMSRYIFIHGGNVKGNYLDSNPRALYYLDPVPAPRGMPQRRNMTGSSLSGHRGSGVSMGTWGTTAVADRNEETNRPAMRVITVEFPGARRSEDYTVHSQRQRCKKEIGWFAASLQYVFLGSCAEEEYPADQ
jgi:hypothetical protein